jgi:predicted nucleic acid-binding protein
VNLFVDTSVWSLALRRDAPSGAREVRALAHALEAGNPVFTTGLVLQELLQGFAGPGARRRIIERFTALPSVVPQRADHVAAADLRNACRRRGVQIGTIDALLAQLCIHHGLMMLTTDRDFGRVAELSGLKVWM